LAGRRVIAVVVTFLAVLLVLPGCGGRSGESRLLIIGIDATDWRVVTPLMESGRLPNIARLVESGVSCDLRTLEPKQASPVIWTTIATGKNPDKHGITGYVEDASGKLITGNLRKVRAFWQMLGDAGRTVTVVGWLMTWPAESVNGFMVSSYFHYPSRAGTPPPEKLAYPDDLVGELVPLLVYADDVSDEDLARFVTGDVSGRRDIIGTARGRAGAVARSADSAINLDLYKLRDSISRDRAYVDAAKHLMRTRPTDVTAIYLRGVDDVSHLFWAAGHPECGIPVSDESRAMFGETVERYYEYADRLVGELLDAFGSGGTVLVCSDHGFDGPRRGKKPGGIRDHGPVGVLVISGDNVPHGVRIAEHSVRDITPTILALSGMPVAGDMDGTVIEDAIDPAYLRAHPVRSIDTYEGRSE
jgi:predicted AlkP superfamily phosphohydrolase/phosphomutase